MANTRNSDVSNQESPVDNQHEKRGRRRWSSLFWGTIIIGGALFLFLPTVLGSLCTSPDAVAWISGQPAGRVQVGRAMLGWQSPVLLRDVIFNDEKGQTLAQVDSITTQRSFWDMLLKPKEPLKLTLDGFKLTIVVEEPKQPEGEFDLQQAVDAIQKRPLPNFGPDMDVKVTNGQIEFLTPKQEVIETWTGLTAEYHGSSTDKIKHFVKAFVPASPERGTGDLSLEFERNLSLGADAQENVSLKITGDRVSLRPAQSWLAAYLGPQYQLRHASGTIQALFERNQTKGWQFLTTTALSDPDQVGAEIKVALDSRYSVADDRISLNQCDLTAQGTLINLKGTLSEVSTNKIINLTGNIQTSWAPLLDVLPPEIRSEIQIEGMKVGDLALQGSILPPKDGLPPLTASMVVQWDRAAGYGLVSQQGQVQIAYRAGEIIPTPIQVNVNGGKLLRLPTIDLNSTPVIVRFQAGPMLENVQLEEEICRNWLKYVSPTLADATTVEGQLSLQMDAGVYVPANPELSTLSGKLTISQGKVRPGPLASQVIGNVAQLEQLVTRVGLKDIREATLMEIPHEETKFLMKEGIVYHDQFGVMIRNMRVVTTGWVALDQRIGMKVAMLIPDKWVADAGPILQALRGEAIELLVSGTLHEPQVDGRPIAEFGKRIGAKAASGLIEKLLERRQQRGR